MSKLFSGLLLCILTWASSASAEGFKFKVPDGWVDLSPGAPPANFDRLPPEQRAQVRNGGFHFYAAEIDGAADGFMENANVTLDPTVKPITHALLEWYASKVGGEVTRQMPGATFQVLDKQLVQISGVTCGRVVAVLDLGPAQAKQIQYLMPGQASTAFVTYSTTPAAFDHYQPIFDAAAQATQGVTAPPSFWGRIMKSSFRGAIIGGVAGGLAVLLLGLFRRRSRV